MQIALNTPARKGLMVVVAAVLALGYFGVTASLFVASVFGSRAELTALQRAARMDPGEADYRYRLGRYYNLVARDPDKAIGQYKAAVQLNPHSARYWFDLAGAYQVAGDTAQQTPALERAMIADPMTPDVAWEAANFYLVQGSTEKALREFRVVIANDPTNSQSALQFCWRVNPDVDALLRDVVPARSDSLIQFLNLLEVKGETAGTIRVWNALIQTHEPYPLQQAYDYIHFLIQHKEVDQAELVWKQSADRFGLSSYLPSASNLVVNNNFNLTVLNAGFDWQYEKQSAVGLSLDPRDFHAGRRSLMITLDGPGITDAGVYQFVPVEPNTAYDFSAYYKTGEIEGAGGPHFTVQDVYSQKVYYESDELKNVGFWKSADGEFTTDPDCKLVVLHLRRLPAGSPIRGKLWVGDFHITRKTP